jgi:hypothetical protein
LWPSLCYASLSATELAERDSGQILALVRVFVYNLPGRNIPDQLGKLEGITRSFWACSHAPIFIRSREGRFICYFQTETLPSIDN